MIRPLSAFRLPHVKSVPLSLLSLHVLVRWGRRAKQRSKHSADDDDYRKIEVFDQQNGV